MKYYLHLLAILAFYSCDAQPAPVTAVKHTAQKTTVLLDSLAATTVIIHDLHDRFFERVTPCEMSIQTKTPLEKDSPGLRASFQAFLQRDMDNFSEKEADWVSGIMKKVFETCNQVNPDIFPDSLILIKTKGNHYGDGVYYTRENCVIIPADIFKRRDKSAFTSTMYHEIFHVYSRLHPEKRWQLYQMIGFQFVGVDNLEIPSPLRDRVLYNPDGTDFGQKITISTGDNTSIDAIPVIYSNEAGFTVEKNTFFSYLEFNLFQVEAGENGKWRVITKPDGLSSTLAINNLPDFFRQIRDNTSYIIHPDEVLADNFSFIMLDHNGVQASNKFSKEGKTLLKEMEKILKE